MELKFNVFQWQNQNQIIEIHAESYIITGIKYNQILE